MPGFGVMDPNAGDPRFFGRQVTAKPVLDPVSGLPVVPMDVLKKQASARTARRKKREANRDRLIAHYAQAKASHDSSGQNAAFMTLEEYLQGIPF